MEVKEIVHGKEVQTALDYIEMNLGEKLTVEAIAESVGFSKFYFHRNFQKEVGIPIYDYIRKRRLANAASVLLNSNVSILDVALAYQFESQESFTRAFKSIYQLPPGRYRAAFKNLINGGTNMTEQNNNIKDWIVTGTAPDKYAASLDSNIYHMGSKSATIRSLTDDFREGEYGTIMQQISSKKYEGKRMRFSAFVKTQDVEGWCGIWFRIDDSLGATVKLDNMQNRAIKGTTEWNQYDCILDIPNSESLLNFGMLLCGKGQAWVDTVQFQEVDKNTPTTDFVPQEMYPDEPLNTSFEEE